MKNLLAIGAILFSMQSFASTIDLIDCKFYIDNNKTDIGNLESSYIRVQIPLENGEEFTKEISIDRLLLIPDEDDLDEKRKLSFEDVIFLFDSDHRDDNIDLKEEDLEKKARLEMKNKLTLKAYKYGETVFMNILSSTDPINLKFSGYGSASNPLTIRSGHETSFSNNSITFNMRPMIHVKYQEYDTPWYWINKMKTKSKFLPIGYKCSKEMGNEISNVSIDLDIKRENDEVDRLIKEAQSIR